MNAPVDNYITNNGDPTYKTAVRVKNKPPEQADVVVIGAGLGGLMAAAKLSQEGKKVAVFDQHYVAGGCCTQFSRGGPKARYNFDVGLHYIGDCGPGGAIPSLLEEVGVDLDYIPMDQDGFDKLVFPDFEFRIPADRRLYQDRLMKQFPKEKSGIKRYVRYLDEADDMFARLNAGKLKPGAGMALYAATKARVAAKHLNGSLESLFDSCTDNQQLRAVFAGQSGDYGLPPSKVSAALHAGLINHYFKGAYYPRGGGQVIADQLAEKIEANGGSIHLRRGIEKVLIENNKVVGVRTETYKKEQFEVRADVVISNADIQRTMLELVGENELKSDYVEKVKNWEMASALTITCLGFEDDGKGLGFDASNIWQFDGYDMEDFYAATDMKPRGCYITSASAKEPGSTHHAPAGVVTAEAMSILPGDPELWGCTFEEANNWKYKKSDRYQELKQGVEEDMIRRVNQYFPATKGRVVFTETATPMSHVRFTRASQGTGYGIACTPEQFMAARPGYKGPVEGLFLAGASTRASHGVMGSLQSGQRCAGKVLREAVK